MHTQILSYSTPKTVFEKLIHYDETLSKALPLIIGATLLMMLALMLAMAKVGSVIGKYQPVLEEVELNQRRNDARMERILISTTSLA